MNSMIKNIIKYGITIALLVFSVYLSLDQIDFDQLYVALAEVDYIWTLAAIPVIIMSHWLRGLRWRTFLTPFCKAESNINLFSAVMVGYLFNNILPRGGEIVRPYILAKREKVSFTSVFGTIIVERVIDLFTLLGLFAVSFMINRYKIVEAFPSEIEPERLLLLSGALFMMLFIALYPPTVKFFLNLLIKPFSVRIHEKLVELFDKFRNGFLIIKKPSLYFRIIVESLLIWFLYALPIYILFFAFPFQTTLNLGLEDALLLLVVSGIGVTIAPTPGAVGVYHFLVSTAMTKLYGLNPEVSLAFATVIHALNMVLQLVVGGAFLFRENSAIGKVMPSSEKEVAEV